MNAHALGPPHHVVTAPWPPIPHALTDPPTNHRAQSGSSLALAMQSVAMVTAVMVTDRQLQPINGNRPERAGSGLWTANSSLPDWAPDACPHQGCGHGQVAPEAPGRDPAHTRPSTPHHHPAPWSRSGPGGPCCREQRQCSSRLPLTLHPHALSPLGICCPTRLLQLLEGVDQGWARDFILHEV